MASLDAVASIMQRVTAVPYYASGACLGLVLGWVFIWVQIIQLIPGLGWLADALGALLPQPSSSTNSSSRSQQDVSSHDSKPRAAAEVHSTPSSFAVMDAGPLGSALNEMEQPGRIGNGSSVPDSPSRSTKDQPPPSTAAAAADAAASAWRGTAAIRSTLSPGSLTPDPGAAAAAAAAAAAQEAAAAGGSVDEQQLLVAVRERLNSFPIDNLSPTSTATALSLFSVLAPAGNSEYGDDEERLALETGLDDAVEGELDMPTIRSTSSNLVQPATASAPAGNGDATAAAAADVPVLSLPDKDIPLATLDSKKKYPAAGGIGRNVHWEQTAAAQQGAGGSPTTTSNDSSSRIDTMPLTDSAVKELNKQTREADAEAKKGAAGGPPAATFVKMTAGSGQLAAAAAADTQQGPVWGEASPVLQHANAGSRIEGMGAPAAAAPAGMRSYTMPNGTAAKPAAASAAVLDEPHSAAPVSPAAAASAGTPRSKSSISSKFSSRFSSRRSSIESSESVGAAEQKQQQGLLAAFKARVGKGRQQVR